MRDVQNSTLTKLLVVDDEPLIRTFMVQVLTEIGYLVRSAHDGFSALAEIRKGIPDLVLSDLNMPGMSGFELLSVIRKRFPSIRVIAMSGSFSGDEVPRGIAADAFYPKGSDIRSLLKIFERLPQPEWLPANKPASPAPLWVRRNGSTPSGEPCVTIDCPECLRSFQQSFDGVFGPIREAQCVHCNSAFYFAIAEPIGSWPEHANQTTCGAGTRGGQVRGHETLIRVCA